MTTAYCDPHRTPYNGFLHEQYRDWAKGLDIFTPIEVDLDEWEEFFHYLVGLYLTSPLRKWTPVLDLYNVMFTTLGSGEHDEILYQGLAEKWIVCLEAIDYEYVGGGCYSHNNIRHFYIHKDHIPELAATLFKKRVLK